MARRRKEDQKAITGWHLNTFDPKGKRVDFYDPPLAYRTGTSKGRGTFYTRYKAPDGKVRRFGLGKNPGTTLLEARAAAAKVQADVAAGLDPAEQMKAVKSDTAERAFAKLVNVYLDRKADTMRTGSEIRRVMNAIFLPKFGHRNVDEITKSEIALYLDVISDQSGPVAANRYLGYIRAALTWLVRRGLLETNPAIDIPAPGGSMVPRDRVLTDKEIQAVWSAPESQIRAMVLLALLTGQRRTPISSMRWGDLQLEGPEPLWRIPAADMKMARPHDVPLSPQVVPIIKAQPNIGSYVFGKDGVQPFSGFSRAMARFRNETGTSGWTMHDCRRTATTRMAPHTTAEVMRAILDHKAPANDMLGRVYNRHSYAQEARVALDGLGRHIELIGAGNGSENVVELVGGKL